MQEFGQEAIDHQLTYRDLDYTPNDGNLYEIIDGALYVTPFPSYPHQHATTQLTIILGTFVRERKLGHVFAAGLKVVLDEPTGVGPDLVYISAARMDHMQNDGYHGCPDLVVEVLSSKPQLDRYIKLNKYATAGIGYYWIVDPDHRRLSAYRLSQGCYQLIGDYGGEQPFRPEQFPGLQIDLSDLWV